MDGNFLEHSLWVTDNSKTSLNTHSDNGFVYIATKGAATRVDMAFLSFFLWKSQSQGWNPLLECSQNHVLRQCGIKPDSKWRARLQKSLECWMGVEIIFQGTFYNGKTYDTLSFRIVDRWGVGSAITESLEVELNKTWLATIQNSMFYRTIPIDVYRLRSPVATRLLELVVKNCGRRKWSIGYNRLAQKLGLGRRSPSYVLPLVSFAVATIRTILPLVDFQYSDTIFSFTLSA